MSQENEEGYIGGQQEEKIVCGQVIKNTKLERIVCANPLPCRLHRTQNSPDGMSERGCCNLCKEVKGSYKEGAWWESCKQPLCSCHTQKTVGEGKHRNHKPECHNSHQSLYSQMTPCDCPTTEGGWEKQFDAARPEQGWMPKQITFEEESETKPFGYKYFSKGNIHEVTDWGHIKNFIRKVAADSYKRGREEGALKDRRTLAEEYGHFRNIETGQTLRFYLLPHSEHRAGDDGASSH